jgi:hypothetical protein
MFGGEYGGKRTPPPVARIAGHHNSRSKLGLHGNSGILTMPSRWCCIEAKGRTRHLWPGQF